MTIFNADLFQDRHKVLADEIVAAILDEDAKAGGYKCTVSHAFGLEELGPSTLSRFVLQLQSFPDLSNLKVR